MSDPSHNGAEDPLGARLYGELRRVAASLMQGERRDHTLQPTALVHEAWMRLSRSAGGTSLGSDAFLALAAQVMRRILTDHARRRTARKRGGARRRVALPAAEASRDKASFVIDVDLALKKLETIDPEFVRLVSLRFFAGYSNEEIAQMMGMSLRTVMRRWRFAKAWLKNRIDEESE